MGQRGGTSAAASTAPAVSETPRGGLSGNQSTSRKIEEALMALHFNWWIERLHVAQQPRPSTRRVIAEIVIADPVCTDNLNTGIMVMKSTQDGV
jgi:hypothetical protein